MTVDDDTGDEQDEEESAPSLSRELVTSTRDQLHMGSLVVLLGSYAVQQSL